MQTQEEQYDLSKFFVIKKICNKYICDGKNAPFAIFAEAILNHNFRTQQELTQFLDCDKAHTSRTLLKMQASGFVKPFSKNITLTDKGKTFALEIQRKKVKLQKKLIQDISEQDLKTFMNVIEQIANNAKNLIE